MGCGGSKEEVATGNMVRLRRLLTKKTDASKSQTSPNTMTTAPAAADPVSEKPEAVEAGVAVKNESLEAPVINANDTIVSTNDVSCDSPDRYFSSRKDEDLVAAIATGRVGSSEGLVYYSPQREPNNEVGKIEAAGGREGSREEGVPEAESGEKAEASMEAGGSVGRGGPEEIALKEEDGKLSAKGSADLKQTIFVEEGNVEQGDVETNNSSLN